MRRRSLIAAAGVLAAPALARGQAARVLRFIPQSDLSVLDPIATTAYVTRNHGYMVFDTLFGQDAQFRPQPQMLDSFISENGGRLWRLRLRLGLRFHDGTPVLARDCIASIRRWMARDAFGSALAEATDALSEGDDRTIVFRLNRPFALLPDALGKTPSLMCAIMPERLARTDPFKPVTEMVGSGPYRFKPDERIAGARVVYERFAGYRPREGGAVEWSAGPKVAHFDRVEWHVTPDAATAAAAMQKGEADWWETPSIDLLPAMGRTGKVRFRVADPTGVICVARLNHLQKPFDNPAIRRALLGAVRQADFMTAVAGTDRRNWRDDVGAFCPDTPMANDAGMEVFTGPRDLERVRREIGTAGYGGEKAVILSASDSPFRQALAEVGADMMAKAGLNVELQAMDFGTLVQRREKKGPPAEGGWSMIITTLSGVDLSNPAGHAYRTNGEKAWFGWPRSERIEALREQFLQAPDVAGQQAICRALQAQVWVDVPQFPVGQYFQPTAYRSDLVGMVDGFPAFWNIRRKG